LNGWPQAWNRLEVGSSTNDVLFMFPELNSKLYDVKDFVFFIFQLNLTSYSTTLRVISSGGGLGLNRFEQVCGPEEVLWVRNGFRVAGESRREGRRDREGFSEVLERWA